MDKPPEAHGLPGSRMLAGEREARTARPSEQGISAGKSRRSLDDLGSQLDRSLDRRWRTAVIAAGHLLTLVDTLGRDWVRGLWRDHEAWTIRTPYDGPDHRYVTDAESMAEAVAWLASAAAERSILGSPSFYAGTAEAAAADILVARAMAGFEPGIPAVVQNAEGTAWNRAGRRFQTAVAARLEVCRRAATEFVDHQRPLIEAVAGELLASPRTSLADVLALIPPALGSWPDDPGQGGGLPFASPPDAPDGEARSPSSAVQAGSQMPISAGGSGSLPDRGLDLGPRTVPDANVPMSTEPDTITALGETMGLAEAARELGITGQHLRRMLDDGAVFGIRVRRRWHVPVAQFSGGEPLPGLSAVLRALPDDLDPIEAWAWLSSPERSLELRGQAASPLAWLRSGRDPKPVVWLAREQ